MTKDDTISAYRDFTEWCKENPSFDLDVRLHTHSGRIGDGGYISDETTRIAFAAWRAAIKADRQKRIEPVAWIVPDFGFLFPSKDAAERYLSNVGDARKPTPVYVAPQSATPKFGEEK